MDQLAEYLKRAYPEAFVRAGDACNLLFLRARAENVVPALLVGFDAALAGDDDAVRRELNGRYQNGGTLWELYTLAQDLNIPGTLLICYPLLPAGDWRAADLDGTVFFVKDLLTERRVQPIRGDALRERLHDALGIKVSEAPGTAGVKPINRRFSDFFHYWSRLMLPADLSKIDLDGRLTLGGHRALIEIKRSKIPPIPFWKPYRDDYPDFEMLSAVAERAGCRFWILHHQSAPDDARLDESNPISFYDVEDAGASVLRYRWSRQALPLKGPGASLEAIVDALGKGRLDEVYDQHSKTSRA